jgi:hypothetical protein
MIVKTVKLVDPIQIRKTDSFLEHLVVLGLVSRDKTCPAHLAYHELESVNISIFIIVINKGIQQGVAFVATMPAVLLHA